MDSLFNTTTDPMSGQVRYAARGGTTFDPARDATPSLFAASTERFSAPHNRTATSIAAARATDRSGRGITIRTRILRLCNAPHWREHGMTQEDICELLDIQTSTCNPRVNDLVYELGHLKEIGRRKISTGRMANVYTITPAGVEAIGGGQ